MSKITYPKEVKLFIGILTAFEDLLTPLKETLQAEYGEIDLESPLFDFTQTAYYETEMGRNIKKKFYSFKNLIDPGVIAGIKIRTNEIEEIFAKKFPKGVSRPVNLDPGYIEASKVVLASAKNFSHRIYVEKGIYAEITLHFSKGGFREHEWTFPDYKTEGYQKFLKITRDEYMRQVSL
ncbi:MAG: DUF4416 family protein [Planctomycetes bacterium]|nr:DUF4416 family protein [Planctomycetota bacterium]